MATKLLRLSAESKSRGAPFPQQLAPNENLEIQIYRLEAYNSLLKDRLNAIIKKYSNCIHSTTTSTMRRPASCSNLSVKRKIILSEDDLHLFEIPEPPTIISKNDNRFSIGSGSAIMSEAKVSATKTANPNKAPPPPLQQQSYHQYSHSSIIFENDHDSNRPAHIPSANSNEEKSCINNLKNIIHKLEIELNDAKSTIDSLQRLNVTIEEKLTDQLIDRRTAENVELVQLRRTMVECEMELHDLRDQYLILKAKAENDLDKEHKKIDELTQIVQKEMDRNTSLCKDLQTLRNVAGANEHNGENIELVKNTCLDNDENNSDVKVNNSNVLSKNDDLTDLLNEAKSTILNLQDEIKSLKSDIETLRQQNQEYVTQIESFHSIGTKPNSPPLNHVHTSSEMPPPIPLEPVIIVKENKGKDYTKCDQTTIAAGDECNQTKKNTGNETKCSEHSFASDDTSQSDNTFVIAERKSQKQPRKKPQRLTVKHDLNPRYSTTDSEISSLDSEENFHLFINKNRKIQNSMMLLDSYRPESMSFSQRMSFLEKAAYYRPLAYVAAPPMSSDVDNHRFLACNCNGIDCDQQNELFYEEIRRAVKNARSILLQEIQNNPQVGSGRNDSEFDQYLDESSECREFLRVQYNLNNLYKQELELICKTCKKQRQELLKQIDDLKLKLQNYEDKCKASGQQFELETDRMLYINHDEGSFELHINTFRPTKEGRPLLSCRHGELGALYVSWNFYGCKIESKTCIRPPTNYNFDCSHIYVVSINKQFLARLHSEKLLINLLASSASITTLIGAVDISLAEVLIFPQNKIQLTTKVMSISNDCDHKNRFCACDVTQSKPKHLGNLTLWFRLTCELDILKSLYNKGKQWGSPIDNQGGIQDMKEKNESQNTVAAHGKLVQNTVGLHASSEDNQECPISQTNLNDQSIMPTKTLITITIIGLKFNNDFELPSGDTTDQIYVEYSFLGTRRMRTDPKPISMNELTFNFTQKFLHSNRNVQRLTHILRDPEQSIKLRINTRSEHESENSNNNIEIGFGLLHLGKCINDWHENGNDNTTPHILKISVLSKKPPYQNIGCLDISVEDMSSLKKLQPNLK
ncbi:uncharacterized protein LOC129573573 [Sitodiplosis mosellana]|uniref:uncharacterized protein LOC129573573 n=1 Tax=Sitodiplosis mosellana TaxID=263140 RepID=UPI002444E76F|nr:uncharacterized protein LOC129573573 [Sitodiplosis mosellana]